MPYSDGPRLPATGGALVIVTLFLSMFLLFQHLSSYENPEEQKFLVGVILMVPCSSVESEDFAMYCFGRYLVACLEPYKLMGERITSGVAVLGDYATLDCPLDPGEVRDSERPIKLRLPHPDLACKSSTAIRESVRDVFVGGGEYIVNDLKFTVTHGVELMEKGFTQFNRKLHKFSKNIRKHEKGKFKTKDDSSIGSSSLAKRVHGIDDSPSNGSVNC